MDFKLLKYLILLIIFLFAILNTLISQEQQEPQEESVNKFRMVKNPEGTDFWLCFMKNFNEPEQNYGENELKLELFITADEDANVTVEIKSIDFKKEVFVPGNSVKNVKIDPLAQIISSERIERDAAVHVTSDNPISVYGLNRRFQTTDTYLGLPKRVLGNEYRVISYTVSDGLMPEFAIVATEDQTTVRITPTANTQIYPYQKANHLYHEAGEEYKLTLNKGDVYQVASRYEPGKACDLTGTLIKSDKKIAVFSGHQCAYVPQRIIACNHLVEQVPPVPSWGKHFFLGDLQPRSKYTYRVLADKDSTKVFENQRFVTMLKAGEFYERTVNSEIQVVADKPILVSQYSQGFRNGDSIGDPMMLLISPTQQFLSKYRFATPINGSWNHYVNIVVPKKAINTMRLNNKPIDSAYFKPLGISRYAIAYLKIPFGTHTIEGDMPFGMYSYGFGFDKDAFDAYGNMGGQSFFEYEPVKDTLPPAAELIYEENQQKIVFRDDQIDDTGIRDVKVLLAENIEPFMNEIEAGMPQLPVTITPIESDKTGRLVVEATDVAMNVSVFTICYTYSIDRADFFFSINEGDDIECKPGPDLQVGIFGRLSGVVHSADFINTGNLTSKGKFSDALGSGGYVGFLVGKKFRENLAFTGRLMFENYGGTLEAPDSSLSHIRDDNGTLINFQETRLLKLDNLYMTLSAAAEWYPLEKVYLTGGINLAFALSKSVIYKKRILIPEGYAYANGSREKTIDPSSLESISFFRPGFFAGGGIMVPVTFRINAFAEVMYTIYPGSLIEESGAWTVQQVSLNAGIRVLF